MKMDLKKMGYQVLDALNVADALKHITQHSDIHAILSDINLGDGAPDGYDFLKDVRTKDNGTPFIFTSGYSKAEEWPKAEAKGATAYLQNPFEIEDLKKALKL